MLAMMTYQCWVHGAFTQMVNGKSPPASSQCTALVEQGWQQWRVCARPSPWKGMG